MNRTCSNCGCKNDQDAGYCENCGSPLRRDCAHCGSPLNLGAKFCNKCGKTAATQARPIGEADRLAALRKSAPPELKEKVRSAAQQSDGQRKPVTILFTDIVGSTAMAEKLDPEEWKEIVSGAHQRVSQAVYRYEGTIAQLLGDGVLAFFGAPVTHEDDPIRAVRAALDIQAAMAVYGRELQGYVDNFQMRIGINTGLVVVASVGSELHLEYLAIGDAVNLAARLQSAAQPGRVLISENTRRLVQAAFELEPLGEIGVKGKTEPVAVYEVQRSIAAAAKRGFTEMTSPLVGREAGLRALLSAFDHLKAGLGQVVWITGEAGIGKSRLVEEAWSLAESSAQAGLDSSKRHIRWLEGRALSYGQKLSFWTIQQLIQKDLGVSDGDPEPRIRSALRRRLQTLFGDGANEVLPYLGNMFGVRLEDELAERVNILDGETLKHQTLLSILRYFSRLAEEQPTALVFDDLHWADPSTLETLERLLPLTDRVPIMLVLLTRLEREHPSWKLKLKAESEYAHRCTDIMLKPLSGDEQNQMVDNLLAIVDLPLSVRERILERAEGNPLFLEEIVRSLVEQGVIVREGDAWWATGEITSVVIPETLRGVLLARIDRLQEEVRRTLQIAAVIGKSFPYRLLDIISEAEEQLESHLAHLQRVDLVREKRRLPELEYIFKHSLTQEAAYHSLLVEQRREFHRRVGHAMEEMFADRLEEAVGLLAYHFDAAGDTQKALSYLIQAGDRSRLSDEHQEALGFYQRSLELSVALGDEERAAQVWFKLGLLYHANFQFEAAHQAYEKAFALRQKSSVSRREFPIEERRTLRVLGGGSNIRDTFDPAKASYISEGRVISNLFSGLAQVDGELNVVPDVARSWQVLDGGTHYLFHLRDDVHWTDGAQVTALDFEWAWKRNLHPSGSSLTAQVLYDVVGALEYHEGANLDPDSVGVRALDALTLEVRLIKPVAYFPFIVTLSVAFPLPRAAIEAYGEAWWRPQHIVSNGAFRLLEYDETRGGVLERNPAYHGEFPGNIHKLEWTNSRDRIERLRAYQDNQTDITYLSQLKTPLDLPPEEKRARHELAVHFVMINPMMPPFNDVRLRRALGLALDRSRSQKHPDNHLAQGGIIPPGIPGHSPDIGWRYDLETARRLLAETGFPNGQGLPVIQAIGYEAPIEEFLEAIRQWQDQLGIRVNLSASLNPTEQSENKSLLCIGWVADYPDPNNFMRSNISFVLEQMGWRDDKFGALIDQAASTPDRSKRLALYRQADRYLVTEQALVLPLVYSVVNDWVLIKPWVKNYNVNSLGMEQIKGIIIR